VEALAEETRKITLGHRVEPGVLYGPVLNESVRGRVGRHLENALRRGGKLVAGGTRPSSGLFDRGYFFEPTLVDDVPDDALAMTDETFGPLAAIRPVENDQEALTVANALPFGLAAYVYSGDLERAWSLAERIEAGAVGVNVNHTSELHAPFGGWKMSGIGRELGREGIDAFRESKHLKMRTRDRPNR
jgi:succinate-semialdehyde dehydrogenase/glutarate-semialdehyde dehydrogenase